MWQKIKCWLYGHEWTFEPYIHCKKCGKRHYEYYKESFVGVLIALGVLVFGIVGG